MSTERRPNRTDAPQEEAAPRPEADEIRLRSILGLLRLAPEASRGLTGLAGALALVTIGLPPAMIVTQGLVVGGARDAAVLGVSDQTVHRLVVAVSLLAGTFVLTQLTAPLLRTVTTRLQQRIEVRVQQRLMRALMSPAGIAHLEDPAIQDDVRLASGSGGAGTGAAQASVAALRIAVRYATAAAPLLLLAPFAWWMPPALLGTWGAVQIMLRRAVLRVTSIMVDESGELRRAAYFRDLGAAPAAAKETRIFGLAPWLLDRQRHLWLAAMRPVWRERSRGLPVLIAMFLLAACVQAVVFFLLGHAAYEGRISIAYLTIAANATFAVLGFLSFTNDDLALHHGVAALPSLRAVEAATLRMDAQMPSGSASPAGLPTRDVRFEKVSFRYPGSEREVCSGLDLTIPVGRSLAIVGVNGAGKTTLVKLLAGLYRPTSGTITADGIDVTELDAASWQRRVAVLFQDYVRYPLSARDNIGIGAVEHFDDDDAIRAAAKGSGAIAIIDALPRGWDTILGREFAGGADLSGGEWQRVALARALMALDMGAGILVLDEPTANLDVRAEAEIFEDLLHVTRGRTTVLISHRFSTVRRADRIVVLDAGRIVEEGSHEELMTLGGRYREMFTLQAARFADVPVSSAEGVTIDA